MCQYQPHSNVKTHTKKRASCQIINRLFICSLSELKEIIENACGVPIDNQVLMTSLGNLVRDTNLSHVVKSQGSVRMSAVAMMVRNSNHV